jgi:hypothetical protein
MTYQPALGSGAIIGFIVLIIWSIIWKGIALWRCGRNNQLPWFVVILIFNTAGILPIVYLAFFQKRISKRNNLANLIPVKKPVKKIVKKKAVKKKVVKKK